jgi:hypothetical protein
MTMTPSNPFQKLCKEYLELVIDALLYLESCKDGTIDRKQKDIMKQFGSLLTEKGTVDILQKMIAILTFLLGIMHREWHIVRRLWHWHTHYRHAHLLFLVDRGEEEQTEGHQ